MGDVGKTLTFVISEHEISCILGEGRPEITGAKYFVG